MALPTASPGSWRQPVSEILLSGGGDPVAVAIADMLLLEELGYPARPVGRLAYAKADAAKPTIMRLKCKPSCWRLYFHPDAAERRLIYLHGVCKKRDEQDPEDSKIARDRLERCFAGTARIARFSFPAP